jgi:hypothetical protein
MTESPKKQEKSEKKNNRSKVKYAALDPAYNLKTRQEEIEDLYDYVDKLNEEEKAWLNAFSNEEICANFNHKGPKLNDQSDPTVRSRIYNRNNERNRCIMTREKAQGCLNYIEDIDLDNEEEAHNEETKEDEFI